jgi:hypothetical protein
MQDAPNTPRQGSCEGLYRFLLGVRALWSKVRINALVVIKGPNSRIVGKPEVITARLTVLAEQRYRRKAIYSAGFHPPPNTVRLDT